VKALEQLISGAFNPSFRLSRLTPSSGGSINTAYRLEGSIGAAPITLFAKCNRPELLDMFVAEADGLKELRRAEAIAVPEPVCYGEAGGHAWLVTEYIHSGDRTNGSGISLGRQLASLHCFEARQFGWFRDNTIGSIEAKDEYTVVFTLKRVEAPFLANLGMDFAIGKLVRNSVGVLIMRIMST